MRLVHVTGNQTWRSMLVSLVLLASLYGNSAGQSHDGAILQKANARSNTLTDLTAAVPYQLHARVVINPGEREEMRGEITIYRDRDRSRTELTLGDFREVKGTVGTRQYVLRNGYPLTGLEVLDDLASAIYLRTWFPSHTKFSQSSVHEIAGVPADCQNAKIPNMGKIRFCFDHATGAVLHVSDFEGWQGEFSDYQATGNLLFPRTMKLKQAYQPKRLELSEIKITQTAFDAAAFLVPAGAREFASCGSVAGHDFTTGGWIVERKKPEVYLYAVVEADGSVHDLKAYGGKSKWAERQVAKQARKWRFFPASCDGTAVASEILLPLGRFYSPGWGNSDSSSSGGTSSSMNYSGSNYFDLCCRDVNTGSSH